MTITKISSAEARSNWREMIDQVYSERNDVIIERNGKDVAVLIPAGDYHDLREELEELRAERRAIQAYEEWQRDASVARSWKQIEGEILDKPGK